MITGNVIRNPGSARDAVPPGYLSGIACAVYAADAVVIRENLIIDDLVVTRMRFGIFGLSVRASTGVHWISNVIRVSGKDRTAFVQDYGNSGAEIGPLILGTVESFKPPIYKVRGGSRVFDSTTGFEWILPQDGGFDRWIVRTWGWAALTAGAWRRGDIIWNTSPSAGDPPGWVCVAAGTPGVWRTMPILAP